MDALRTSVLASRVAASAGLLIALALFVLGTSQQFGVRRTLHWRKMESTTTLVLFGFGALLTQFTFVWRVFLDFTAYPLPDALGACGAIGALQPLLYITTKQVMYAFLWQRADIVIKALHIRNPRIVHFSNLVLFVIVAGVPLAFGWVYFVTFQGRVSSAAGGICEITMNNQVPIAVFALCDLLLNVSTLGLFVVPLREHKSNMGKAGVAGGQSNRAVLERVIRRNIVLSVLAFVSTDTSQVFMFVGQSRYEEPSPGVTNEYFEVWAFVAPSIDLTITLLLTHCMTVAWIPNWAKSAWATAVAACTSVIARPLLAPTSGPKKSSHVVASPVTTPQSSAGGPAQTVGPSLSTKHGVFVASGRDNSVAVAGGSCAA
jgi:hypothetical protein